MTKRPTDDPQTVADAVKRGLAKTKPDDTGPKVAPELPWKSMLRVNDRGEWLSAVDNLVTILRHDVRWTDVIAWDDFQSRIVTRKPPMWHLDDRQVKHEPGVWSDADSIRMANWFSRAWGITTPQAKAREAVEVVAHTHVVHPVRDYLNGLKWDGQPRLGTWLHAYLGVPESEYATAVGTWWVESAVARILQPGCKADHALVLEGEQGIGKSTALKRLGGDDWYTDQIGDIGNKDAYLALRGKWIIELAELEAMSKAELAKVKAFFTSAEDHYRPPYGRETQTIPRQSVFAGSTNETQYLRDSTGNRRFWPVRCAPVKRKWVDVDGIERDRDQLWAEAVHLFEQGQPWWPAEAGHMDLVTPEQDRRFKDDPWADAIEGLVQTWSTDFIPWSYLYRAVGLDTKDVDPQKQNRISSTMRRLGWEGGAQRRHKGEKSRGFERSAA